MESTCKEEIVATCAVNDEVVNTNPYAVDKEAKLAVETNFDRFAVETKPPIAGKVERYPADPRPITVLVSCEARYVVETRLAKFAVETNPLRFALDIYPADPSPITVEVS